MIRGEPVSIGSTVMRRKSGVQNLSTSQKLGILGGILIVIMLGTGPLVWASSVRAAPAATPTPSPSATCLSHGYPDADPLPDSHAQPRAFRHRHPGPGVGPV